MTYHQLLQAALGAFAQEATQPGPVQRAVYVATACGGVSEVGLYTLVGGYLRQQMESHAPDARLLVDSVFRWGEGCQRPDFQVHLKDQADRPALAVEFKFISDAGEGSGHYRQVLGAIDEDQSKLAVFAQTPWDLETAAVVFFLSEGHKSTETIVAELEQRGFANEATIDLWHPNGVTYKAKLYIFVSTQPHPQKEPAHQGR
ncbi:MAG TPA: hypothetical protein PKL14_01585 [Holophaga sp.]|nr:hypothetical protein [Holophaga sp.]